MTSNPLPLNISRYGGCTLTGALSVTTHVRDTVTIIHGPKGCTHHNFSLLHATGFDNDQINMPDLISTGLSESDIIFGGEAALDRTLDAVAKRHLGAVFVLSTCIVDTIGDDVAALCRRDRGVPVLPVPSGGFLGGTFQNGVNNALNALADTAEPCTKGWCVNIIGEKNLEYEVEENYAEVSRLLAALGISVNLRFVRDCSLSDITRLGAARLNILRDDDLRPVGERLHQRFATPFIPSFPVGLTGTIGFLESVADSFGVKYLRAVHEEKVLQEEILTEFRDITGTSIAFDPALKDSDTFRLACEIADVIDITIDRDGCRVPLEISPPVGTTGVMRMLHRWRRAIHA
ncbi:MAG TPA: nitrogenase component 1 [Methanoregula sp.]|nr:nitrogenase component 1 [Methanoregula sp.]